MITPEKLATITEIEEIEYPSLTYQINLESNRINGLVDEEASVMQSVIHILSTERYAYGIYNSEYGVELEELIGKDFDYVVNDIPRRVIEALSADDRVLGISDYAYEKQSDALSISFTVNTIFGDYSLTMEVNI